MVVKPNRSVTSILSRLIVLYYVVICGSVTAQEFPREGIKAELIMRIISHTSWGNEERSSFRIAFLRTDPPFYNTLKSVIELRKPEVFSWWRSILSRT
jgi:hypothetical protein